MCVCAVFSYIASKKKNELILIRVWIICSIPSHKRTFIVRFFTQKIHNFDVVAAVLLNTHLVLLYLKLFTNNQPVCIVTHVYMLLIKADFPLRIWYYIGSTHTHIYFIYIYFLFSFLLNYLKIIYCWILNIILLQLTKMYNLHGICIITHTHTSDVFYTLAIRKPIENAKIYTLCICVCDMWSVIALFLYRFLFLFWHCLNLCCTRSFCFFLAHVVFPDWCFTVLLVRFFFLIRCCNRRHIFQLSSFSFLAMTHSINATVPIYISIYIVLDLG